ncbi:hypothetical protein E2C01_056657 [Portunus trituberculatus]|uniref:Uncharacterized protein n=1 Tax=Portunus trituberculatus TaxID=210409 RepID=A0A5B7GQX6_PORTR|nr:hypothetical protein [Portunus trituberculatus]
MKHRMSHLYRPSGGAFTMTVPVARETLKIDGTDMNTFWKGGTKEGGMSLHGFKHAVSRAGETLQHPRLCNIFSRHEHPLTVLLQIFLRNRADLFGQVPRDMDETPTPISVLRHKATWRWNLADF